tara:strand:+ start:37 stop:693 length:657 start_codon:yes stop_codon:yes gene_type:complete
MNITHEDNMNLMSRYPDNYFDIAIVDPPYGIGEDGGKSESRCKSTGVKPSGFKKKGWDKSSPNKEYFNLLKKKSKNQIIFGANHFLDKLPFLVSSPCWIVWNKCNGANDFADCELAWTSFSTAVRLFSFRWHGMLQGDMKNKEQRIHPTQKPVVLYEWILNKYAKQGDKILDTHLGSGSIAIACHNLKFELTACELDKEYFDNANKRILQHKSQKRLF